MALTSPSPATPALSTSPLPSQQRRHSRRSAYRTRCGPVCSYCGQPCPLVWAMTWSAGASASPSISTASGSLTPHVGLERHMLASTLPCRVPEHRSSYLSSSTLPPPRAAGTHVRSEPCTQVHGRALCHTAITLTVPALVLLLDPEHGFSFTHCPPPSQWKWRSN
jgi:hypothetical protein